MVIVDTTVWIDYLRGLRNKETVTLIASSVGNALD